MLRKSDLMIEKILCLKLKKNLTKIFSTTSTTKMKDIFFFNLI